MDLKSIENGYIKQQKLVDFNKKLVVKSTNIRDTPYSIYER
ncbi:hypothetical protein QIA25_06700 (plasmid) [Borreliella spielmanii]|uniref:Uncharacterized protein n=1 Tax=Borreliella spielmanii A14S TaxID=498742 RepID=B9X959_9SPIR|nr:hypothetical protein [Borreliella spielmanii]EEF84089.1 hypothetical protein BSPA14S_PA0121 [Borreliella spielmanii A14S]